MATEQLKEQLHILESHRVKGSVGFTQSGVLLCLLDLTRSVLPETCVPTTFASLAMSPRVLGERVWQFGLIPLQRPEGWTLKRSRPCSGDRSAGTASPRSGYCTARGADGLAYVFGQALQSGQIICLNHISHQPASSLLPHAILSHSQSALILWRMWRYVEQVNLDSQLKVSESQWPWKYPIFWKRKQISSINTYMWNLKRWYRWSYFVWMLRGGCGMRWEIGLDIYTLLRACFHSKLLPCVRLFATL